MASRALGFSKAHPADDPGYAGVVERLEAQVKAVGVLNDDHRRTSSVELAAVQRRTALRRKIRQLNAQIVTVAQVLLKSRPELVGVFPAPRGHASNRTFLSDSRILLEAATTHRDLLTAAGLGQGVLAELEPLLPEFEDAGLAANENRDGHVAARGEINRIVADCMDLVRVLDAFNRSRFAPGSGDLLAWQSASDVFGSASRPEAPARPDEAAA